ncbi:MAG: hypothetical protein KF696_03750 [Planctomycetes bacterium]|nr:hypothetical protein [Planctomycetota bacterium]MCW8134084.1 hypothetical protein [Planctomycetota bacterium]
MTNRNVTRNRSDFAILRAAMLLAVMLGAGTLAAAPQIKVEYDSNLITNGGTVTFNLKASTTHITGFAIRNSGNSDLSLPAPTAVTLSNKQNVTASVETQPASIVTPNWLTTFMVRMTGQGAGPYSLLVTINSDDAGNNPFTFTLQGVQAASENPSGTAAAKRSGGGGGCVSAGGGKLWLLPIAILAELAFLARLGLVHLRRD